jgi:glycosyltransferase involved in cell wall biosynthesis
LLRRGRRVMPLFSVIITTHNRPRLLREAVASVLAQTVQDHEVLVVDDGSTPPAIAPNDRRIRIIRKNDPGGPAAARNAGMRASRGKYLVFLDDDDLFTRNRLALGQEGTSRAPIAVCEASVLDQRSHPWIDPVRMGLRRLLCGNTQIGSVMGRTDPFPQVGQVTVLAEMAPRFDERLRVGEDVDWWIRASGISRAERIRGVGYIRRLHDRPRVRSREDLDRDLRSTMLLLEKNAEFFAKHPGAAAYRWRRIAFFNDRLGRRSQARDAFRRAAAISGEPPSTWEMTRTYLPIPRRMRSRL